MSTKFTDQEMSFLRNLTPSDPFNAQMRDCQRTIDLIIDAKGINKSLSEVR